MASNADGHIIIDLQLQQDEFDKRLKELEGKTSGFGSRVKTAMKAAVAAGTAAFAALIKKAVDSYAEYEQLVGGVETLFKKSKDVVLEYADNAYKTAGMSANEYMSIVTSFSASLLQSLGQDTKKAAKYADRAITDMSDNANKMGSDISTIQNAYQGFAKQNYTMLDNLKLGYGGTKTEMQRLIKDASKMKDVQKELGITVDGSSLSFANIVNAISVMQKSMGIAGTTLEEADKTIEGSANSMKAAWSNLLTGMADENANVNQLVSNLVDTIVTYVGNIGPRILKTIPSALGGMGLLLYQLLSMILESMPEFLNSGSEMLANLSQGFVKGIPDFISNLLDLIQQFADNLAASAPIIIQNGFTMLSNLVQGITKALPILISRVPQIVTTFANIINDNFPTILSKGSELLWQFILGILSAIPVLIANIPQIIEAIVSVIQAFQWMNLGKNIINGFLSGIKSMFGNVSQHAKWLLQYIVEEIKYLPQNLMYLGKQAILNFGKSITNSKGTVSGAVKGVFNAVIKGFKNLPSQLVSIGSNLVKGLWNGISSKTSWIVSKVKGFGNSVIAGLKNFFGIHSPSKVMADKIGQYLPEGIAVGFRMTMPDSIKDMEKEANIMTDNLQRQIDMNMKDFGISSLLQENIEMARNNSFSEAFPKSLKVDGNQHIYLVTEDGTEIAHWLAPYIDKELKLD